MSLDDHLRSLAETQYSLVSRRQARELGATASGLESRLRGPAWDAPTRRVLRLVGSTPCIRQQLLLAVLDSGSGATISHGSAATAWRLPGFSFSITHISRPRSRSNRRSDIAVVHHPRLLPDWHVTERHGIPVTTLARTLFDVAGDVHPARLDRLVDTVLAKSPSMLAALHAMSEELTGSGRAGMTAMRSILAARPSGYVAPASGLEARFARILTEAGERPLERQIDLGGHEWVGRVDFYDRALAIVVEIDSDIHHTSLVDRAHDRRRDERLREAGWREIVRVSEDEVWRHPHDAVAKVRTARRRAARILVSESHATA